MVALHLCLDLLSQWLSKGDNFTEQYERHRECRAPNSGQWFLNEFDKWFQGSAKCLVGVGPRTKPAFAELTKSSRVRKVRLNVRYLVCCWLILDPWSLIGFTCKGTLRYSSSSNENCAARKLLCTSARVSWANFWRRTSATLPTNPFL